MDQVTKLEEQNDDLRLELEQVKNEKEDMVKECASKESEWNNLKAELKKENPNRKASDTEEMNLYFDLLAEFIQHFPQRFQAVDPLERVIPEGEEAS